MPGREPLSRTSVRIVVSGRVQGVSFRASLREEAVRRGVDGWVRNKTDGSVEALLQGDKAAVRSVIEWARTGPPRAEVLKLEEEALESHPRQAGFTVIVD